MASHHHISAESIKPPYKAHWPASCPQPRGPPGFMISPNSDTSWMQELAGFYEEMLTRSISSPLSCPRASPRASRQEAWPGQGQVRAGGGAGFLGRAAQPCGDRPRQAAPLGGAAHPSPRAASVCKLLGNCETVLRKQTIPRQPDKSYCEVRSEAWRPCGGGASSALGPGPSPQRSRGRTLRVLKKV